MPLLVVLLRGLFVLLQLGGCHIRYSCHDPILLLNLFALFVKECCHPVVICSFDRCQALRCLSCFSLFHLSCVSGYLPLFYSLWSYISLHIICYIWDLTTDHTISTNCNQTKTTGLKKIQFLPFIQLKIPYYTIRQFNLATNRSVRLKANGKVLR